MPSMNNAIVINAEIEKNQWFHSDCENGIVEMSGSDSHRYAPTAVHEMMMTKTKRQMRVWGCG